MSLFTFGSSNISIEEIYGIDYNSSIYQFQTISISVETSNTLNLGIIGTSLVYLHGLDGVFQSRSQLGLTILTSSIEACASFAFLGQKGAKSYKIRLQMFTNQENSPSLKGFMSLPNQTRSFDRFQLFDKTITLPENKETTVDYLVYSLKILQKRNTFEDPCVDVDNYDKVFSDV
jgi:hypothetical protein